MNEPGYWAAKQSVNSRLKEIKQKSLESFVFGQTNENHRKEKENLVRLPTIRVFRYSRWFRPQPRNHYLTQIISSIWSVFEIKKRWLSKLVCIPAIEFQSPKQADANPDDNLGSRLVSLNIKLLERLVPLSINSRIKSASEIAETPCNAEVWQSLFVLFCYVEMKISGLFFFEIDSSWRLQSCFDEAFSSSWTL